MIRFIFLVILASVFASSPVEASAGRRAANEAVRSMVIATCAVELETMDYYDFDEFVNQRMKSKLSHRDFQLWVNYMSRNGHSSTTKKAVIKTISRLGGCENALESLDPQYLPASN